ncbi:MAG: phosphate acetyltransferase [Candidatus Delongbacteria bacterium]|nr:phosphate acetyltransferase [Candidatus Delongbacteria bacterium]
MDLLQSFRNKAQKAYKTIVLPEGCEPRTIKAAAIIHQHKLARVILVGNAAEMKKIAAEQDVNLNGIDQVDPETSTHLNAYTEKFYELRKSKGITPEEARKTILDPVYYATMMVYAGDADGLVSGAQHSTADTIRPALQIIKTMPGISIVSSAFIMLVPDCEYGENGMFIFADCAVNPNPNADQLAEIAISSAENARVLCSMEPRVAMLSFSTQGSAKHELVDKVQQAVKIAQQKAPQLKLDGELQADAAIIDRVGKQKAPGSPIAGQANVLVFPDLQSGNIGYKLVERLAKAQAIGPFLQGLKKPVNDLSRGCSVDDIVNVVTITAVQAAGI